MIDVQDLFELVDQLSPADLEALRLHIEQRQRTRVWEVSSDAIREIEQIMKPTHELTVAMSDEEIDAVIHEAIEEVRGDDEGVEDILYEFVNEDGSINFDRLNATSVSITLEELCRDCNEKTGES